MSPITLARMGLLLLAIAFFIFGLNTDTPWARWVAVGCAAATLLLRIVDPGRRR